MERISDSALTARKVAARPGSDRAILARRAFVWFAVVAYGVFFTAMALLRHETFNSTTFDLAIFDQAMWNTLNGRLLGISLEPTVATSKLAYHFEPILIALAPLYWLYSNANAILILQSVALALGALPVSWLAYDRLGSNVAAAVFALAYLLFPGLQAANMFDFHAFTLTAPLILFAFYFMEKRRYWAFAVCCVLAMASKENVPLTVAMLGLYTMFMQRAWRVGLATIAFAAVWFLFAAYVVIPSFNGEGQGWLWNRYGGMGGSPLDIVVYLVSHPEHLIEPAPGLSNLFYMGQLLFPLAFLSLLHPPTLILAAPGLATNLLTTYEPMHLIETYHYTASLASIVTISAIYGTGTLADLAGRLGQRQRQWLLWALAAAVFATSFAYHYYRGYTPLSPSFSLTLPNAHHDIGHRLVASIPPGASVAAQFNLGPHVSQRFTHIQFPEVRDADYIFVDASTQPNTGGLWNGFHDQIRKAVNRPDYGVVAAEDGFILLRRGAPNIGLPDEFYSFARTATAAPEHPLNLRFGDELELIGFDLQDGREASLNVTMYWRALKPVQDDYLLALYLTDGQGKELGATLHAQPANYWYPTSRWQPGEIVKVQTHLLPWAPGERDHGLGLAVVRGKDPWAVASRLPVAVREATWAVAASGGGTIAEFVTVRNDRGLVSPEWRPRPRLAATTSSSQGSFANKLELVGHSVEPASARPGESVLVRLNWQVQTAFDKPLTAFVHVLAPGPNLVAQKDAPPLGGRLPTTFWQAGDSFADEYLVTLPADVKPGEFELAIGLYDPLDGKRVQARRASGEAADHLLLSTRLTVVR